MKKEYRALDIAKWFLWYNKVQQIDQTIENDSYDVYEGLTHLKIQNLLYYAEGVSLAVTGKSLFSDKIYAWTHGPVIKNVYEQLSKYGKKEIDFDSEDFGTIDIINKNNDIYNLLVSVYDNYAGYTAWKLREKTHVVGGPWQVTVSKKGMQKEIDKKLIKEFFKAKVVKYDTVNNESKGILDAKELACYIKQYYKNKFKKDEISPLKLQKSLYFCFAYWGGFIRKNNAFSEEIKEITLNYSEYLYDNAIEAWVYGPVVPDVYYESNLERYEKKDTFNGQKYIQEYINNILDDILSLNDFKLVEISHEDNAWKKYFKPKNNFHNIEIQKEKIIREYAKHC